MLCVVKPTSEEVRSWDSHLSLSVVFQMELELVQSRGVPSEDIIFSGVSKQLSQMKYAAKNGIDLLVCDNEAELCKISRCHPNAKYVSVLMNTCQCLQQSALFISLNMRVSFLVFRLLLQVSTEAFCQDNGMAMAFGCSLKDCRHLLERAKELGVQVVGVR